jgi:hypothetical protein
VKEGNVTAAQNAELDLGQYNHFLKVVMALFISNKQR